MWACGSAATANFSNDLPTFDMVSPFNKDFFHVGKLCCISVSVINFNVSAIAPIDKRFGNSTVSCGDDILTIATTHINAGVISFLSIYRVCTASIAGSDRSRNRTAQRQVVNGFQIPIGAVKDLLTDGFLRSNKRTA